MVQVIFNKLLKTTGGRGFENMIHLRHGGGAAEALLSYVNVVTAASFGVT